MATDEDSREADASACPAQPRRRSEGDDQEQPDSSAVPEPNRGTDNKEDGSEYLNSDDVALVIQEATKRMNIEIGKRARLESILSETEKHFVEEMRKVREEKAELESSVRKLTAEKARLMLDLEESKNVLFELRPEEQVSDAEIQRRYSELRDAIETWIDLATDGDDAEDFNARFTKVYRRAKKPLVLYNLLLDLGEDFSPLMEHDNFDYFVLTALIQQQLDSEMASRSPIGISQTVLSVLREVQRSMAMLDPPKGRYLGPTAPYITYIEGWRSSALAALVTIPEVREARDTRAEEAAHTIISLLKPLLSKSAEVENLETKLLENVLKPAYELTQIMCISTHRYAIRYPKKVTDAIYRNLDGWTTVKRLEQIERVVRKLHPALLLLDRGEQYPIVLVKPVVAVSCRESMAGSS